MYDICAKSGDGLQFLCQQTATLYRSCAGIWLQSQNWSLFTIFVLVSGNCL